MKVNKAIIAATTCVAAALCANAAQYWRGTTENPVWDLTTANWASSSSATTYSTYQNNTSSSQPYFDAGGATDVTVDPDGVLAYVINTTAGNHTWRGGPVTAQTLDPLGGDLTIYNTVNLTTDNGSQWYGFRPRAGGSTITVGDGGVLAANLTPLNDSTLDTKLVVLTNGTLKAMCYVAGIRDNKFTLYFDGGNFIPLTNTDWRFVNSQFLLGAGGVHLQERTAADSCWSHLPGPIGTDETLPTDGGVWIDQHEGYMLLPNFTSTYRGGVHINSSKGYVGFRGERHLGAEPDSPTNNIFFLKSGASLVAHGGSGTIRLHPNRNLYIADEEGGFVARLQTWSGNRFSMIVQGTIGCENVTNGVLEIRSYSGIADDGVVALCPTDGRTNNLGRLLVKAPAVIGSGTTLLHNNKALSVGTGAHDESWSINDGCPLNISGSGHLMVTGGVLMATGNRPICNSAKLTISGGGVVDLEGTSARETRHAYSGAATTTIRNGGKLIVARMRMAGDEAIAYDATKSVVNIETGGTLRVTYALYITGDGKKGTLNFNGGMLDWGNPTSGKYMEEFSENGTDYKPLTRSGLVINALEGGMNVTCNNAFYVGVPVLSGAENDGGVTKWGSGTFALMGKCTFNGPLTIMQGDFRLGASNVLNSDIAMCVNTNANFIMNTYSQTLARIEGSGSIWGTSSSAVLAVTSAIAPGMGADSLGTLRVVDHALDIADDVALEIDVDTEGNSDCLLYGVNYQEPIDLSRMTLQVNDLSKLNRSKKYTIATLTGGIENGALFKSTNLPAGWDVRYSASTHELKIVPVKGTRFIVR